MIIIKKNAAENSITIDGTRFDVPVDPVQREALREVVVNAWCYQSGQNPWYPDAINGKGKL